MNRSKWICTVASLVAVACSRSPEQDQAKAAEAQHAADDKAATAQREANDKAVTAQNEADEKAAKAKSAADKDTAKAQANANDTIREANRDIVKARTDLRTWGQKKTDEIDGQIDDAKVKAQSASAAGKAAFNEALKDVQVKRDAVRGDMATIDAQTNDGIGNLKARLDKEIDDLKASVSHLRSTL